MTPSITVTNTPYQSPTPSSTITPTFTITDTPLPTATPNVPAVLDRNLFRPEQGQVLHIGIKAPQPGHVVVHIFNVASEKVRRPFEADVPQDITQDAVWDGRNEEGQWCGAGIYVVSVQGAGISSLKKVILLR